MTFYFFVLFLFFAFVQNVICVGQKILCSQLNRN